MSKWLKAIEPPKDAKPLAGNWRLTINPHDKFSRSKGLNYKENSEFLGVCDCGSLQLIDCYNDWDNDFSVYDFCSVCHGCPHYIGASRKIQYFDPHRISIFSAIWAHNQFSENIEYDDPKSFVYFISDSQYVKVGKGISPTKRLSELQTGNPKQLSILYLIPCKSEKMAYDVEQSLHLAYRDYRMVGEWFNIMDKLIHAEWEKIFPAKDYINELN